MRWRLILSWVAVAPAAVWALIRVLGWDVWYPMAQLIAFTPYVAALSVLPLALTVLWRRWDAAIVAGLATIVLASCVLPRWLPDGGALAGAKGPELRVLTANLLAGAADTADLLRIVREEKVDVLLVQELTQAFSTKADAAGISELLPHKALYPARGVQGSGIYSRLPLRDDGLRRNPFGFGQAKAELVPYGVLIESAHPVPPSERNSLPAWRDSFPHQPRATVDGPLRILAGDFNATLDHSLLRELISSGYRDAGDVKGKGLTATWGPYDGDRIPPVTLDRVLADRRIGVHEVRVFDLLGSDHRPVLAVLKLP